MFQAECLNAFWLQVKKDSLSLAVKANDVLLFFATSYLCDRGFSSIANLENKVLLAYQ